MAHLNDLWRKTDPATGKKVPTARDGKGRRWLVRYIDPTGARKSATFDRKVDAEDFKTSVEADVLRGEYIDPRLGQRPFAALARDWLAARVVAPATLERDRSSVESQLVPAFGDTAVADLRPSQIRAWIKTRSQQVSASTLNLELWTLSTILDTAVEDDLIRKNPCAVIKRQPVPKTKISPWPLATIRAILDHHAEHGPHVWPVPALAAGAGLRVGEAFGVAVDDIDFLRRELHVRRQVVRVPGQVVFAPPKRNSVGTVPLPEPLVEALSVHVAEYPPVETTLPWSARDAKPGQTATVSLLTVGRRGAPLRRAEYNSSYWYPALDAAGIERAGRSTGVHVLRHCYASYLLASGCSLPLVQARMRHGSLTETVETYAHLVPGDGQARMDDPLTALFGPVGSLLVQPNQQGQRQPTDPTHIFAGQTGF